MTTETTEPLPFIIHPKLAEHFESCGIVLPENTLRMATLPPFPDKPVRATATTEGVRKVLERLHADQKR